MEYKKFNLNDVNLTKYIFYTGKGGVGKTSIACSTATNLADSGKKVLLISTDPASNLQDVFNTKLDNKGIEIKDISNLTVINLNPIEAAKEYRENIIEPYRGKLPESVINNMEEQLSGSCTVEIAAFNEFAKFLTDKQSANKYDYIIFDTAPTGHTLRMLQLPSAWSNFINESTHGASCLGQLSGLESKKEIYVKAVETLVDKRKTTLIIVTRPENSPLLEAKRASDELSKLGINNQIMIINGVLMEYDDNISKALFAKQQQALQTMPKLLQNKETYVIPLRAYNITGINNVREFFSKDKLEISSEKLENVEFNNLDKIIEDIYNSNKKVIFTMGKGGVGKTTLAATIAVGLSKKGKKVHLTTTDPANHLNYVIEKEKNLEVSYIDEAKELEKYKKEVLAKASQEMNKEDIAYVEEDLKSPCTQEIAVFRAFANIVEKSEDRIVVIDTAPTGHTLLLLDSTQSYNKEIKRTQGDIPESVKKLLPRLKNKNETEVIIITLPEATPVYEAMRLEEDLKRAGINNKWWVINQSMLKADSKNEMLKIKASNEIKWINKVNELSKGKFVVIAWNKKDVKGKNLLELIQ